MGLFDWIGDYVHDRAMHTAYWNHTRRLRQRLKEETKYLGEQEKKRGHLVAPQLPVPFKKNLVLHNSFMLLDSWDESFSAANFIEQRGGAIKKWRDPQSELTAAQLIMLASKRHYIDPRLLIVSLQREKSIIRRPNLPQKVMEWACGVGAWDGDREWDPKYKGFGRQIDSAAETYKNRFNGFTKGEEMRVDFNKAVVTPENAATYALYVYTPHIHAAQLTHVIWKGFFGV